MVTSSDLYKADIRTKADVAQSLMYFALAIVSQLVVYVCLWCAAAAAAAAACAAAFHRSPRVDQRKRRRHASWLITAVVQRARAGSSTERKGASRRSLLGTEGPLTS